MKVEDLIEYDMSLLEVDDEAETVKRAPPPGELGQYITTAQAAKILGVGMARVRQFKMENRLKSYSPEPGRRDNFWKRSEIEAFKDKAREITGRPEGSTEDSDKKEKDD